MVIGPNPHPPKNLTYKIGSILQDPKVQPDQITLFSSFENVNGYSHIDL